MRRIAITGTIGSGKSEVSNYLRNKYQIDVFDCDKENSELLKKGNLGYLKVKEVFEECFDNDELNKAKLASIIFNDENKKKQLEDIMHPLILEELNKRKDELVFAEVPLLFEANWDKYFDESILVVSKQDIVKERLLLRGLTIEDINQRIANQMSVDDKMNRASQIIYNNGSLQDLYNAIDQYLNARK